MKDLKPCPFCGETPAVYSGCKNGCVWAYVSCDCGIRTINHHGSNERESIALAKRTWNTRFVTCKCGEEIETPARVCPSCGRKVGEDD